MSIQISISNAIGARAVAGGGGVDPDAQAFITASGITDATQQSAINQLVVDLKGYNIWTKMKALYPFVGGTNAQHAWNLKNTAQYKITWYGGVTSSSNGITGNGTNGYGDTFLANNVMAQNDAHISVYSRTDFVGTAVDIASWNGTFGSFIYTRNGPPPGSFETTINSTNRILQANADSRGFYLVTRKSGTSQTGQKNTTQYVTATASTNHITSSFKLLRPGEYNGEYSPRNLAFASIGDGLTDTEAANLYTAVQTFQTTLGRSIGTQTVSDADAQAFVTNAGIVDQVEANAVNNLVIGLKADGLWTKMKAVYPMVGGSSSTMKYNLKNPLDTDAAFRLVFNGGLTYSSTGLLGGVNGYADTKLAPSTSLSLNNTHISFYSRTDTSTTENVEMGINDNTNNSRLFIAPKFSGANSSYRAVNSAQAGAGASPNMQGFFIASRVNSTAMKLYRNASVLFNDSTSSGVLNSSNIFLLCYNSSGTPLYYTDRECAFASIGDGLDDTEATNLNTRVTTFQTALNRNV